MNVAAVIYRVLLRCFPRQFRERFGADMEEVFADRLRRARRAGWATVLNLCAQTTIDMASHGLAERRADRARARSGLSWRARMSQSFSQDVRYVLRSLLRRPGFTVTAMVTLALGIGANVAIFSVVNTVLLRPLPYPHPEQLTIVWQHNAPENIDKDITSFPSFEDWRARGEPFGAMAGWTRPFFNLTEGSGDPERVRGAFVTSDFFDVLGVPASIGRVPAATEHTPGGDAVVVLSHSLWTSRFGADPTVVGRKIQLNSEPCTVIGVMPAGFEYPDEARMWLPLEQDARMRRLSESRGSFFLAVIGRLKPGVSVARAQSVMTQVAADLEREYPAANSGMGILLEPLTESVVGPVREPLLVLLGAVGFVLLIACANMANLLVARGATRHRELAIRMTLGAGRRRIGQQVLVESLVLGLIGGVAGVFLAGAAISVLASAGASTLPRLADVRIDGVVAAFAVALSLVTGAACGVAPVLQAVRADLNGSLRDGGRSVAGGGRAGRLRPLLVVAELALALILLTGAGLMIRTMLALQRVNPGFETTHVLTARLSLPGAKYDGPRAAAFFADLVDRVGALPGVASAGAITAVLLPRLPNMSPVTIQNAPPRAPDAPVISVVFDSVTPGYFEVMRLRLVDGRFIDTRDRSDSLPVAVVNETFVRTFLADGRAIGRRFTFYNPSSPNAIWLTVAGVVADTRRAGVTAAVRPEAYAPLAQSPNTGMTIVARTTGDPLSIAPLLRQETRRLDPDQPIAQMATVEQLMAETMATRRFVMRLLAVFSGLAATLATIGIYGVMSFLAGARRREMGIRLALGARPAEVVGLIVRQGLGPIVVGLAAGLVGAWLLTSFLASQMFGVTPHDPWTFATTTAGFFLVGTLACYIPARRTSRVDARTVMIGGD
jgi:putative ABC transport system permease protein